MLRLLHLCDSLFPIGSFGYSDGLEGSIRSRDDVREWLDVCVDETIGRFEGPIVMRARRAFPDHDTLRMLDEESIAMRPSASARKASRSMGHRLITTWAQLYPDPRLAESYSLPVAFGCVCSASDIDARTAVEAFAYTRLAATVSAAMRLVPIGQTEAHQLLATALSRVPELSGTSDTSDASDTFGTRPESFVPRVDIAQMSHQYLHSRLFRT